MLAEAEAKATVLKSEKHHGAAHRTKSRIEFLPRFPRISPNFCKYPRMTPTLMEDNEILENSGKNLANTIILHKYRKLCRLLSGRSPVFLTIFSKCILSYSQKIRGGIGKLSYLGGWGLKTVLARYRTIENRDFLASRGTDF